MKLGLITQFRNEIDIIEPFLRHVDSLFDIVFLLDHQSIDGTTEIVKQAASQRDNWRYFFLDFKGKFQKNVSNLFLSKAFSEDIDFLFFLDADEFILVSDRETLESQLNTLESNDIVGKLKWTNCIPTNFRKNSFTYYSRIRKSQNHSILSKVVIPRQSFIYDKNLNLVFGNHVAKSENGVELPMIEIGELLHIPIRSKSQTIRKAIITDIALSAISNRPAGENYQYNEFIRCIAENQIDVKMLKYFVQLYDTPDHRNQNETEIEQYWENAQKTSLKELDVAFSNKLNLTTPKRNTQLHTLIADALLKNQVIDSQYLDLTIENNTVRINEKNKKLDLLKTQNYYEPLILKINELESINEDLKSVIQEREQEICYYALSKSWKFTRPLRKLMIFLKRLRSNKNQ